MKNNFMKCGVWGLCLETLWTGFGSFRKREKKLNGHSSLWMFPIYGSAALIHPLSILLQKKNVFIRGFVYMCAIFSVEYVSGMALKKRGCCPWDYSQDKTNIHGVIRLNYAPLWFLCGLFYEHLMKSQP